MEGGARIDAKPKGKKGAPGIHQIESQFGFEIPTFYPPGRTALVEGKGEGKRSLLGDSAMRSDLLWGLVTIGLGPP